MSDRSVIVKIGANVMGFVNGVRTAERAAVDFGTNAMAVGGKYGAQLDNLSNKAGILGAGLVGLAGFAVKSAMDWETAWAGVTKTINGTPQQLDTIEQGLRSMSTVLPTTAVELAGIAESAGALGVATEDILSFTRVMADLGQTTNLSSDEAATSIAQLMNVMKTAPDDVDNLGATLVDLGNKGASTERQIVQMAQNIAGAGSIVGLTEANVLALGNALASSGIDAEAGGSAISNVLIDIDKAVSSGGDKLEEFASVAGTTADEFAAKWQADPADALADFVEGLGKMNESGGNVFATLSSLGQSDIRVTRALLNMAASGDMLRQSLSNGDAAWQKNTALAIEAAKRYDTTASQVKMSWNEIKNAAVDAGQGLLPVVSKIASTVGALGEAFSSLPDPVKGGLTAIAGVGGVALIAAAGMMKLVTALATTRTNMGILSAEAPGTAMAVGKLSKAVGVATIALGAYYAINQSQSGGTQVANTESFTKALLGVADGSDAAKKALDKLVNLQGNEDIFTKLLGGSKAADIGGLKDLFDSASRNKLQSLGNKLTPYDDAYDTAKKGIEKVDAALTSMVNSGAVDQASAAFDYLGEATGRSVGQLKAELPGYAAAVQGVSNQQNIAAKSSGSLADAWATLPAMSEEAQKAMEDQRKAAGETANSFFDISQGVNDAKLSLDDWISQMNDQAKALSDFADNAEKAGKRGLEEGLIQDLQNLGPEGAMRLQQLADASDSQLRRANKAWLSGQDAIDGYVDKVGGVPDTAATRISTPGLAAAIGGAGNLLSSLNKIDGKVVKAVVKIGLAGANLGAIAGQIAYIKKNSRNGGAIGRAGGGSIIGAGTGRSDSIPAIGPNGEDYRLSNGEHVLAADEVTALGGQQAVYAMRRAIRNHELTFSPNGGIAPAAASAPMQLNGLSGELTITNWETGEGRFRLIAASAANNAVSSNNLSEAQAVFS